MVEIFQVTYLFLLYCPPKNIDTENSLFLVLRWSPTHAPHYTQWVRFPLWRRAQWDVHKRLQTNTTIKQRNTSMSIQMTHKDILSPCVSPNWPFVGDTWWVAAPVEPSWRPVHSFKLFNLLSVLRSIPYVLQWEPETHPCWQIHYNCCKWIYRCLLCDLLSKIQ